jgi:hypothetical protein
MAAIRHLFNRLRMSDPVSQGETHQNGVLNALGRHKSNSDFFSNAATEADLFAPTKPEVDGDDCLHDCTSCSVKYPTRFNVEMSKHLYGHIKAWDRHVLVATGKSDWVGFSTVYCTTLTVADQQNPSGAGKLGRDY